MERLRYSNRAESVYLFGAVFLLVAALLLMRRRENFR
jgi:LPXTG-motif cell wall-anchored protein